LGALLIFWSCPDFSAGFECHTGREKGRHNPSIFQMNELIQERLVPRERPELVTSSNLRGWLWNCYHGLETGTVAKGARHDGAGRFVFISANNGRARNRHRGW